jgi:signal peptidase I
MIALLIVITLNIAALLLVAGAVWLVGRLRKSDPRRGFGRYVLIVVAGSVSSMLVYRLTSSVSTTSMATAYATMAIGLAAQLAAVTLLISLILGIKGRRVFIYLGAYVATTVLMVAIVILVVRPYVLETFYVPANSMSPTIRNGDRILASKWRTPQRWDIVVFETPTAFGVRWVKRIVALPGETLMIKGGLIYINGQPLTPPVPAVYPEASGQLRMKLYEGYSLTIPPGQCFLLGDNSANSLDSRFIGPVEMNRIVAVAEFTYWPIDRWRMLR